MICCYLFMPVHPCNMQKVLFWWGYMMVWEWIHVICVSLFFGTNSLAPVADMVRSIADIALCTGWAWRLGVYMDCVIEKTQIVFVSESLNEFIQSVSVMAAPQITVFMEVTSGKRLTFDVSDQIGQISGSDGCDPEHRHRTVTAPGERWGGQLSDSLWVLLVETAACGSSWFLPINHDIKVPLLPLILSCSIMAAIMP